LEAKVEARARPVKCTGYSVISKISQENINNKKSTFEEFTRLERKINPFAVYVRKLSVQSLHILVPEH
jgi:hypothetical protein